MATEARNKTGYESVGWRDYGIWFVIWLAWVLNIVVLIGTGHEATAFLIAGTFVLTIGVLMALKPSMFAWLHYLVESATRRKPGDPEYESWLEGAEKRRKVRQWTIVPFMVLWGLFCVIKFSLEIF